MRLRLSTPTRLALAIVVVASLTLGAGSAQAVSGAPDAAPTVVSDDTAAEAENSEGADDSAPETETGDAAEDNGSNADESGTDKGSGDPELNTGDPADDTEAPAPAPPALPAPLTSAPEQLEVRGSLLIIPDDTGMALSRAAEQAGDSDPDHEHDADHGDRVLLATTAGPVLDISEDVLKSSASTGGEFVGTVTLPEVSRDAIATELSEQPQLENDAALEIAAQAVAEAAPDGSQALVVAEGGLFESADEAAEAAAAAAAATKMAHSVDVVFYSSGRSRTETSLRSLVATVGTYWKGQTEGGINGISVRSFKQVSGTSRTARCNYTALWEDAAARNARTVAEYRDGIQEGRHLVTFVDDDCGGATGRGSVGYPHQGGVVWVDLGAFASQYPAYPVPNFTRTFAHEIGHNLGMGHSNLRLCTPTTKTKVTTPDSKAWFDWNTYDWKLTNPGCSETEYADVWSPMGSGYLEDSVKPASLAVSQKDALGFWPQGVVPRITANGGMTQSVSINAASATSGVRGVKVASPVETGDFYLEYRNGLGQDSGLPWGVTPVTSSMSKTLVGRGVQVLKLTQIQYSNTLESKSSVIPNYRPKGTSGDYIHAMRAGDVSMPYGDMVRVTVTSLPTDQAKLKIEYKGFSPGTRSAKMSVAQGGGLVPGKTLSAAMAGAWTTPAAWAKPGSIADKYQWLRNGKAISGATGSSYRPINADIGATIAVRVLPSATGFISGTGVTSNGLKVNPTPFIDVAYGHKFYTDIEWMKASGISTGTRTKAGDVYAPKSGVTREAMAAFMYRLAGAQTKNYKAPSKSPFIDVPTNHKFYKQIAWMYSSGLSTGTKTPAGRAFNPASNITREAMAAFLYRFEKGRGGKPVGSPFADVPKGTKFEREISWMYSTGLSTGVRQPSGKPRYLPKDNVSREAMAAFLYRLKH